MEEPAQAHPADRQARRTDGEALMLVVMEILVTIIQMVVGFCRAVFNGLQALAAATPGGHDDLDWGKTVRKIDAIYMQ